MKFQKSFASLAIALASLALPLASSAQPTSSSSAVAAVSVDAAHPGPVISKYIYGQFIEHLGRSIYGGIWAEMLDDRKFFFDVPARGELWKTTRDGARVLAASPWKLLGPPGTVTMVKADAFVGYHSPQVNLPGDGQAAGVYQEELGLLKGKQYTGYIYLSGDAKAGPVTVTLAWGAGPNDHQDITIKRVNSKFTRTAFTFTAGADSDNGRLTIASSGAGAFKLGCVSLMPADNVDGFRADTLALLRQLQAPVYRWPGGNFVSGYDWHDGLGDRDRRPPRSNPAWTGIEPNDVGMAEYIRFSELVGSEPLIAVNTGFGDAYSCAAQVEYANGSVDTPMGKLRAQQGHPKPFNVKFWCVGNEMYGTWQLGYMKLQDYEVKHNWIEEKMRAVDPHIVAIASGNVGEGPADANTWTAGMLATTGDHMDLISEHLYVMQKDVNTNQTVAEHVQLIPAKIKHIADAHRIYRQSIPAVKGRNIMVSLDEWNYWYGPHLYGELGTRYFLKDALGIAAGLHEYYRDTDVFFMANYAQTVNVIGCIKTTKTTAEFDATAFPLVLYRQQFGTIPLPVSHQAAPLDISAALTENRKEITVGVVNPTKDPVKLKLNLASAKIAGPAKTWFIGDADPLAYNEPGKPRKLDIKTDAPANLGDVVTVRPYSITLWRAPLQ